MYNHITCAHSNLHYKSQRVLCQALYTVSHKKVIKNRLKHSETNGVHVADVLGTS